MKDEKTRLLRQSVMPHGDDEAPGGGNMEYMPPIEGITDGMLATDDDIAAIFAEQ